MRVWKFNTDLIEARDRVPRWCEAMSRNNLPVKKVLNADRFRGSIMARESTLGLRTTIVQADAQIIEGEYGNPSNSIWLSMLIEGSAILKSDDWSISLKPRDIIYGRTGGAHASILYEKPFRQIFLVVPQLIIDPRLLGPVKLSVGCIRAQTGISRIYSKMLLKVADGFEGLRTEELRPIELSMTEFLISCVLAQGDGATLAGAAANRAAHLNHICQTIETHLGDVSLDTRYIAELEGVSMRYLQKLFSASGDTFARYVRSRRLERCRADLINPAYSELSITDICFRWGFGSSSHFSRVFRETYGISPRDFRKSGPIF